MATVTGSQRENSGSKFHSPKFDVYVGNLDWSVNEDDLKEVFKDFKVSGVRVTSTGTRKYAFVDVCSENNIRKAVKQMPGTQLKGRSLVVRAGNAQLHSKIQKEIELEAEIGITRPMSGLSLTDGDHPPPLEAVYMPCLEGDKVMPPPLEPVILNGHVGMEDMPPPLERVLTKGYEERDDLPPPLEPVFDKDLEDLPPPLEPVYIKGVGEAFQGMNHAPVTLLVANFPFGTTEEDLLLLFKAYSPLKVTVILNKRLENSNEKTYAYVTLPDRNLAKCAVFELDNIMYFRRKLDVTYMLERIPCT